MNMSGKRPQQSSGKRSSGKLVRLANSALSPTPTSAPIQHNEPVVNSSSSPTVQAPVSNGRNPIQVNEESSRNVLFSTQESPNADDSATTTMSMARRGKTQIWPDSDGIMFCAEYHPEVTRKITEIYKGKFDEAHQSWAKVPKPIRDLWFNELKKYYWWEDHYELSIRHCFEERGKATMRDTLKEVRKCPTKRPKWLAENVWKDLWAFWNTETLKLKSETAKKNRASTTGVGSSLHTGGSIPTNVHKMNMINEGIEPTVHAMFLRRHQTKGNKWVDEKAAAANEKYQQKLLELQATPVDDSHPQSPITPSYDEQMQLWIEANGLTKRGRLYGFGVEGDTYTGSICQSSSQKRVTAPIMHEAITTVVEENKRQKVLLDDVQAKLKKERTKRKKQSKKVAKLTKATKEMHTQMFEWFSFLKSTRPDIPTSNVVLPLLSESEDDLEGGSENNNNDDDARDDEL